MFLSEVIRKFHILHVREPLHYRYQIIARMFPNYSVNNFKTVKKKNLINSSLPCGFCLLPFYM